MKSAILILDLQAGLFDEPGKPFDYENMISKINRLTRMARSKQMPVIFIQHETAHEALKYKSRGWELVSDLDVNPQDYVVRKTTPNSFLRTNLADILEKEGVRHLIICGYATEYCVDSTIRAAAALGYEIDIVSDGHTTHDKDHASAEMIRDHHNKTLSDIISFGVKINALAAEEISRKYNLLLP